MEQRFWSCCKGRYEGFNAIELAMEAELKLNIEYYAFV